MELIKEHITLNEDIFRDISNTAADGDIIVPDKKPDILKILQVDAQSVITAKSVSGSCITVEGKINLKILYVPDRADEKIKSIITDIEFTHRVDNPQINEGMSVRCVSDVQRIEFNVINSRKLNVKAVVSVETSAGCERAINIVTGIKHDGCCETETKPICIYNTLADNEEEFVVRGNVDIPSGKMSLKELLKYDCHITDKEIKVMNGKVILKGTVESCFLFTGEDNNIDFMETDTPFTEVFEVSEAYEDALCEYSCSIADVYAVINEDSDGDMRIISFEYLINVHIRICRNTEPDVVSDFYCPGFNTDITRSDCRIDEIVCHPKMQTTVRENISIDSGMPPIDRVYNVITKAYINKTSIDAGKLTVQGIIDSYILYLSESIDSPVSSFKKEIPFSYVIDAPGADSDTECIVAAETEHTSYNINMSDEVEIRTALIINARIVRPKNISLIDDAVISDIGDDRKHGMVIYFVQKNDKLWDIAKRYRVSCEDILKINEDLDKNALKPGSRIIIPMMRKYSRTV
ncbi:MAG: DUF3794 domain-containing protein [Oscillospiraceae bacterium]|nr:DUF3794 domain-containing protein [Oscillospiraceae bacterium]